MATLSNTAKPGTRRLRWVVAGTILLCAAGVVYAVRWGTAADGGRGGALAVALTFAVLFAGRGTSEAALEVEMPKQNAPAVDLEFELARVRNAVASLLDWQRQEKNYLVFCSVLATLVWGFGDVLAKALGAQV